MKRLLALFVLTFSLTSALLAKVGDAFDLKDLPSTWAAGQPIDTWQEDDLYLFEFWATWCGPCLKAIPHMEQLWKEVKGQGIHFIGVNVNREEHFNNQAVMDFLAKQPVKPSYAMIFDKEGRLANRHRIMGIPTAVAVKQGIIVWQGHPAGLTVEQLKALKAVPMKVHACATCNVATKKHLVPPTVLPPKPMKKPANPMLGRTLQASAMPTAENWAQGTPITAWAPGHLYVLEFWASWCGPCRAAIPHLEELHRALMYKGVTFVGINLDRGYTIEQIRDFMERQPVHPTYGLVYGTESQVTQQLNPRAIPHAVIVRDGKILWAGHPGDLTAESILQLK